MSKDIAIEANALTKTYPPDVRALDGLSLAVPAGTIFGLLGPNGAGKSTTVRILTTLSRPDSGSARVAGVDVLAHPVRVRHAIGVVAQKHGLDPEATGRENLTLQGEFYAITGADLRGRVARCARALRPRRRRRPAGEDLLGRHAAPSRPGHGPHPPAPGAVPRRADHRPRSRGARRHLARDRAPRARRADDDPAHHPLPRGGRSAGLAAGHRRPRADRRRGLPRRAQEPAGGRPHPGRARRRPGRRGAPSARGRRRRRRRGARGPHPACPCPRRRGGDPRRAGRPRRARREGRLRDPRAPVARRRLPAPRGAQLRPRRRRARWSPAGRA